jgi:adenylate cyclase
MLHIRVLPDDRVLDVDSGETLLAAAIRGGVPHTHVCGGNARCSTCRVLIVDGLQFCETRNEKESAMASRLKFTPEIRLACQSRVNGDVTMRRLALDSEDVALCKRSLECDGSVGQERRIAILFADIRGFTPFAEALPPYDVIHVLNRHFFRMGQAIEAHGGAINNYMGDGLMALFGLDDPAGASLNAVEAGLAMLQAADNLKPYLERLYGKSFDIGVGIHVGEAIVGNLGAANDRHMTAIGDPVNMASRVESATKEARARLLISEEAYHEVKDDTIAGRTVRVPLKGKTGEYTLYEITGLKKR